MLYSKLNPINYLPRTNSPLTDPFEKKWTELGLDQAFFKSDPQGGRFLIESHLIFSVIGFNKSTQNKNYIHNVRLNNKKIEILKEGAYTPAVTLERQFRWQSGTSGGSIVKKDDNSRWTYLAEEGLVQVDRWEHPSFPHVTKLDSLELNSILQRIPKADKTIQDRCIIQVITNPRGILSHVNNLFTRNVYPYTPIHAFVRIIDAEGKVYSSGFGFTEEENKHNKNLWNCLSTINGMPTILDYEEFRPHKGRITTSFRISTEKCRAVLDRIETLRKKRLRFQIMKQNCATLAAGLLYDAGVLNGEELPLKLPVKKMITKMSPFSMKGSQPSTSSEFRPSFFKKIKDTVREAFARLGHWIRSIANTTTNPFINALLWFLGANQGSPSPTGSEEGDIENELENNNPYFKQFDSLGVHIFSDKKQEINHSYNLIKWQLENKNTWVHSYRGPNMNIFPSPDNSTDQNEDSDLKQRLQTAYGTFS